MQNSNWREEKRLAFNFRLIIIIISPPHRSQCNVSGTVEGCKFLTCAFILINSLGLVPHHKIWKIGNLWNKISIILMKATHWSSLFIVCGVFDLRFHFSWGSFEHHGLCSIWPNCHCLESLKWRHFLTKRATWFMSQKRARDLLFIVIPMLLCERDKKGDTDKQFSFQRNERSL